MSILFAKESDCMKRKLIILTLLLTSILCMGTYAATKPTINENIIRLHVIANSDSDADQKVKLLIRDEILKAFKPYTVSSCKTEAEAYLKTHLLDAEEIANQVLKENGFTYTAHAEYGIYEFPLRTYGNVTLPAGKYNGLRIKLGESAGQNWWCVMYPPLCFNDLNTNANETGKDDITFEVKFKIAELWEYFK